MRLKRTWERSHLDASHMNGWIVRLLFLLFGLYEQDDRDIRWTTLSWYCLLSCEDWLWTLFTILWSARRRRDFLECHILFKGILVVNIASDVLLYPTWKPLKTSYTVVWFHFEKRNCASRKCTEKSFECFLNYFLFPSSGEGIVDVVLLVCWTQ